MRLAEIKESLRECMIVRLKQSDLPDALSICEISFDKVGGNRNGSHGWISKFIKENIDINLSVKAVCDGKIVGVYILQKANITEFNADFIEDISQYKKKKGVEGVALALLPEYRGSGIGKMLIEYSYRLPFDYIWCQHMPELENIEYWKKRQRVVAVKPLYITIRDL